MFTGIIEELGRVEKIEKEGGNKHFTISSSIAKEVGIDQSVSHNGVCLTIVDCSSTEYTVTAIHETLIRSNLGLLNIGDMVNLERCSKIGGRLDGHIVQGHVDQMATVESIEEQDGSWVYGFSYKQGDQITVQKGSVCVNGISLTVVDSAMGFFSVAIIPYTYEYTNFHSFKIGSKVNLEFDIIGKYVTAYMKMKEQ